MEVTLSGSRNFTTFLLQQNFSIGGISNHNPDNPSALKLDISVVAWIQMYSDVPEIQILLSIVRSLCAFLPGTFQVHHIMVHTGEVSDLCVCRTYILWGEAILQIKAFLLSFFQMMSLPLILEIFGMYLFWRVWEPARCSLRSWSSCRWCRVHSATCTLSRSHPSSRQTGCCMMLMTSWQSTSHLYVDV